MESVSKRLLTNAEKNKFIATMTPNLSALRTHAEISQETLANFIGVSRQTYSAMERKVRRMSWSTYLSLILFFDHNKKTHAMLRMLHLFPQELITCFNDDIDYSNYAINSILEYQAKDILEQLDEKAKLTINSMILTEYTRCKNIANNIDVNSSDSSL